ncbi:hypothetical protein [Paludisphaera sp.]|uniref:hypothetical protein n=1 Tax=Paludisphaera sp. TaxID=2017432 RepID=UPI00301C3AD8
MNTWYMLAVGYVAAVAGTLGWGVLVSLDARREEWWRRRFLAVWPFLVTILATFNAGLASLALLWLGAWAYGADMPAVLIVAIPILSALTAFLTWKALRVEPDRGLVAWMPHGSKKLKPSDPYRDLE